VPLPESRRYTLYNHVSEERRRARFARDVAAGLTATPKRLPCCYFYDAEGSRLFDEICALPEYYLPAAEREILAARAEEIGARFPVPPVLVELGSGSAVKTRVIIDALLRRHGALEYMPIDISRSALTESAEMLSAAYPALRITAVAGDYLEELRSAPAHLQGGKAPKLILWLGSSIGNLDRPGAAAFLRRIAALMGPADRMLVGIDLRKDRAVVEPAYNDARGVTARFNLNLLARINRELDGGFDLEAFRHRAIYDEDAGRIEMYLVSTRAQSVPIGGPGLAVQFAEGETVHTEDSYKYSVAEIAQLIAAAGMRLDAQWEDRRRLFSANLLKI
jgi:L-histidine N-alpha-methyltransferase